MDNNLIPGDFIYKLFDQVKESSKQNSNSIEKLSEHISAMADVVRNLTTNEIDAIKKMCEKNGEDLSSMNSFLQKHEKMFKNLSDFELDKFRRDQEEKLKILRWLALKFKIIIAIVTAFFLLTGGSYVVVKYLSHRESTEIIDMIKKENNKLVEDLKKENEQMKKEIMSENQKFREDIIRKIKSFHPDFDVKIDK